MDDASPAVFGRIAEGTPPPPPRRLAGPAIAYWGASCVSVISGLVRGKILAESVGRSGVGLFAQLANLLLLVVTLAALGCNNAGINALARARGVGDTTQERRVLGFIMLIPAVVAVLFGLGVALASHRIAQLITGSPANSRQIAVVAAAAPFALLAASIQIVMQGYAQVSRLAVTSLYSTVVGTIITVALVVAYGLNGAIWSMPASALAGLGIFVVREWRLLRPAWPLALPDRTLWRYFLTFGAASLAAAAWTLGADLVLRSILVHREGVAVNGTYQPVFLISTGLFAQLCSALVVVVMPASAELLAADRSHDAGELVRRALRLGLLVVVPACFLLVGFRHLIILTLFSPSFRGAEPVMVVQALGEIPRLAAYILGASMLPAGLVRAWLTTGFVATVTRLSVALVLLPHLGVQALAWSFVAEWSCVVVMTALVMRRRLGVTMGRRNMTLLFSALAVQSALGLSASHLTPWAGAAIATGAAALWVWCATDTMERQRLLRTVRARAGRTP